MSPPPTPKRKSPSVQESWQRSVLEPYATPEKGIFGALKERLRLFFFRLTRRRAHTRHDVEFSDPMQVRLVLDGETLDVAPYDISKGGMGLEVPIALLQNFKVGERIKMKLSFDGKFWHEAAAEVRFLKPANAARGSVGIRFENVSLALLQSIDKYEKSRR